MLLKPLRKFGTGVALLVQAALVWACVAGPQPLAFAANEAAPAAPLPTITLASPAPTLAPSPTQPPPTETPTATPTVTTKLTATEIPHTPTIAPTATLEPTPTAVARAPLDGAALVAALQRGGYVIYFRNATSNPSQTDTATPKDQDCSTQRNLSDKGRAEALAIGRSVLALGIPVGQVLSSAYCRARDTALLAFGQMKFSPDLTGFPIDQREARIAALRALLSTGPAPGTNTVLVAHGADLTHTTGLALAEGEAAIFAPLGPDAFALVARLLPLEWVEYRRFSSALALDAQEAGPSLILPDLEMLPPSGLILLADPDTGKRQLRFTSSILNRGPGVMELWGHSDPTSGKSIVVQHIKTVDNSLKTMVVGEFIFHPEHNHFHFANLARYEIWSTGLNGELETLLSVADKVSYCLRDDEEAWRSGFDVRQTFISCEGQRQGITPGWIDVYPSHLFGQSIDVSNLPDGTYALVNTVDPDRQLWELDQANDTALVLFQLERSRVAIVD